MSLPPVFAASALYDNLLQAALRQFFSRATFETEPIPSLSSDGRLAIEPTHDPSVLSIRWFGSRHVLYVPARRPFTPHEVRLARAIGTVLAPGTGRSSIRSRCSSGATCSAARSRIAMSRVLWIRLRTANPAQTRARPGGDRHRGAAGGGAFELREPRHLVGCAAAEKGRRTRSVGTTTWRGAVSLLAGPDRHQELLPPVRRPADAVPRQPRRGSARHHRGGAGTRGRRRSRSPVRSPTAPTRWRRSATGTSCIVLSPSHEIKIFAEGDAGLQLPERAWHLLDIQAKYDMWAAAVGNPRWPSGCSRRRSTWPTPAKGRCSWSCAMRRSRCRCWSPRRSARRDAGRRAKRPTRAQLMHMLRGRTADRPRSRRARGPRADRRRDGDGQHRPAARGRRDPAALGAAGAALEPGGGRRPDHRGDGRRPATAPC